MSEVMLDAPTRLIIKPEKVRVVPAAEGSNVLVGEVMDVAYLGASYNLRVQIGAEQVLEVVDAAADASVYPAVRVGSKVNVRLDPEWLRVIGE